MESKSRSFLKALSWRLLASAITGGLVFCFTGLGFLSLTVGVCNSLIKIFIYYLHERVWTVVPYGRRDHPLYHLNVRRPLAVEHERIIRQKLDDLGYLNK
jgi:uncharacterized membrane protein